MTFDHNAKWFFIEQDPNDMVRSTARRHSLEGSSLNTVERVVREAIQNSVDATLPNEKTEVVFQNQTLSGKRATEFRDLLRLGSADSPTERLPKLGLRSGNSFELLGKEPVADLDAAIIEDYNTYGLGYEGGKDRFEELCLSFGQDTTSADATRGGSYGFGKEVYEESSDCNTFLVYSVFEPCEETEGRHARLFGCATFDGHEWNGRSYKGRALFGVHRKSDSGQTLCRPLVDEQAHEVARRLGFEPRSRDDRGTSIMIVGSRMEMGNVRYAVERYWWPRILSNLLSVELCDYDAPEPKARSELSPYIDCYEMIERDIPVSGSREKMQRLNRVDSRRPGTLALKGLDDGPEDENDDDDELANSVAMVRSGPKMVVQYMGIRSSSTARFVGAFVSHPDAEEALHLSEPPSHDSWNPDSQRIQDAYPNDEGERNTAQRVVRAVIERVRRRAREFQRNLNPVPPPSPIEGTKTLARMLANLMSSKGLGITPPPPRFFARSV